MKKSSIPNNPQPANRFTKRAIIIALCLVAMASLATSCYTTQKCPAYGHYSQLEPSVETDGNL